MHGHEHARGGVGGEPGDELDGGFDTARGPADRIDRELREIVVRRLEQKADALDFSELHDEVLARRIDPYAAADKILQEIE